MRNKGKYTMLACAVMSWMAMPVLADNIDESPSRGGIETNNAVTTRDVNVEANRAIEEAKYESQSTTIITADDIAKKQAKSVEEIIFNETGVTRTVDAMGKVGVSIRGAEPRHTLILIDGQPVMGDLSKYSGAGDELQRLGTENVERIEIIRGAASAKYGTDAIGGVVNVITKRAQKTPSLEFNAEGRRMSGDGDVFPYQNVFLRADSGQVGKARLAVYGGKRDIMPVYEKDGTVQTGQGETLRNSLRYYGDIKNIGFVGTYEFNERNKIDINLDRTTEDLRRDINRPIGEGNDTIALRQQFKRTSTRDKQTLTYTGNNGGSTDWKISYNYSKMRENDVTVSSYDRQSAYEGTNTLDYVDDLQHKEWNINASANTQINDRHLLTYGFGYTRETGEGARIKNAKNSYLRDINPFDYDKNIKFDPIYDAQEQDGSIIGYEPSSNVHAYTISYDAKGIPYYNQNYEYYGQSEAPAFTKADYDRYGNMWSLYDMTGEDAAKRDAFAKQLANDPSNAEFLSQYSWMAGEGMEYYLVGAYYNPGMFGDEGAIRLNGKTFKETYDSLTNKVRVGKAEIKKHNFFIQDTWQVNDNTILSPIIRLDHSDLFGSEVTFNLGMTHNIKGRANHRLKANVGTSYTEPGMGELYYSWQMYGGSPAGTVDGIGSEVGRLGYYWMGNPNLKPEKAINFDIGLESENGKTSTRVNVFHNRIDDYMTTYFTGNLLDFHPGNSVFKFINPPDMIYSFKNIGKAEITGVEAELQHQFNKHWSGRLGYTYLHALNKSDPNMPDRLLDKPQHKVDIGITYENKGWRASLWGNYYINMLDSNSIVGNGNYMQGDNDSTHYFFEDLKDRKNIYQKKTFSIWNLLIQKELSKDASMYVGVDNIFNHRDDDRALQERVYKMGVNLKFGPGAAALEKELDKTVGAAAVDAATNEKQLDTDWFIQKPFDTEKTVGVEVIGDYRARWNSYTGESRPAARITATSAIGDAEKNMIGGGNHGFEQRLRLGIDARVSENTNVKILGSASGMSGVDTGYDISDSKGLNHQRLENVDITQHVNKWDFSVGRLTEPMGVTGYWFGKEYDGGRAVWTSGKSQVRIGFGDFSHSTGITDSAYTHATRDIISRVPTKMEWLGYNDTPVTGVFTDDSYSAGIGYEGLYQKLKNAASYDEQVDIVNQYLAVIKESDAAAYNQIVSGVKLVANNFGIGKVNTYAWELVTVTDSAGNSRQYYNLIGVDPTDNKITKTTGEVSGLKNLNDAASITAATKALMEANQDKWTSSVDGRISNNQANETAYLVAGQKYTISSQFIGYGEYTGTTPLQPLGKVTDRDTGWGNTIRSYERAISVEDAGTSLTIWGTDDASKQKAIDLGSQSIWNTSHSLQQLRKGTDSSSSSAYTYGYATQSEINPIMKQWLTSINAYFNPENGSTLPLEKTLAGKVGSVINVMATVLVRDQIPSIDRAFFVQVKREIVPNLGIQAWYLRSVGDDTRSIRFANDNVAAKNEMASFDQLANVIGIGARYRFGTHTYFSFDWGQNRTDFGRFMNGHTLYNQGKDVGSAEYFGGRANGGTPRFWVARIDIGHADTDVPGSWNAFADYKYFQHGSFFGGNGTEALPDRYLDGIKSFTIGGGYVPAKNLLIEAFYTFGAKGINKRDTLYGAESFSLGDYTRIQATYKF